MKNRILLIAALSILSSVSLACSNVAVTKGGFSVTARTMDFPFNTGNKMGLGLKGQQNVSDLNRSDSVQQAHALHWTNQYDFTGQTWLQGPTIVDGINDAGVYAAYLYLPDFTQYPADDLVAQRSGNSILGAADLVNYILGTASSVQDALNKLHQVTIVKNSSKTALKIKGQTIYMMTPIHVIIRDKQGDAAVIEWVDGKTVIYPHAGAVLTNSPDYDWQVQNAQRYDYVSANNINVKYDGAFMNGSGFSGMPGDFSSPSRFARGTQIVKNLPVPQNNNEAIRYTLSALESLQVPLGANGSPSFWKTVADLQNNVYFYYPMYVLHPEYAVWGQKGVTVTSPDLNQAWQRYDLNKLVADKSMQQQFTSTVITATPHNTPIKVVDWIDVKTAGPEKRNLS